ncbi:FUSC family protein [Mangrovimonas sp. AS39]|uniref:FUSC family protein n=1 Tax=Mangrovimonas TaxID=1211036 RepID=UPI000AE020F7|nr:MULTISPECIES: FUSC family protein [Mangrovimonas]MCF1192733.1 FUSC family protein [Mangrovimonas futianensis]MCF1196346.1 FUSC family protein [Mangrovimonas futianensis]MCF1422791.1 FUSC family protein [Mangrovimonas futianensis]
MKKALTILAIISSILAVILSVLPLSNLAFIPAIGSLIFGLAAFYFANKNNQPKHTVQLAFLLTIIALSIATYKSIFTETEVGNTEALEKKEEESVEDSMEILEGLDTEEIDGIEVEELDGIETDELEDVDTNELDDLDIEDEDL